MIKTVFTQTTKTQLILFLALTIFLSSCQEPTNVSIKGSEKVQVTVPLTFNQDAVFLQEGRTQEISLEEMDLLGIVIESSHEELDSFRLYANGVFTNIPDSLQLSLFPEMDYKIFAFFYENDVDSIFSTTTHTLGFRNAQLNQMLYGPNVVDPFKINEAKSHTSIYCRAIPHVDTSSWSTKHPIVTHYATSLDFQFETDFIDTLTFQQHNTRFEVSITNTHPRSRIVVGLGDFVTIPIASDTTFTIDLKQIANPISDLENEIIISVNHDYISNGEHVIRSLHTSTRRLNRLEVIRMEITAPDTQNSIENQIDSYVQIEDGIIPR